MIADIRKINTRNGSKMAFVILEDLTGSIELVLFPKTLKDTESFWVKDKVVKVTGKVNSRNGELKFSVDKAANIPKDSDYIREEKIVDNTTKSLYIKFTDSSDAKKLQQLKDTIDDNAGDTEVVIVIGDGDGRKAIRLPVKVDGSEKILDRLRTLVGEDNLAIK